MYLPAGSHDPWVLEMVTVDMCQHDLQSFMYSISGTWENIFIYYDGLCNINIYTLKKDPFLSGW